MWKTDIIAEQSFWASLITWICGLDVSSCFYNCGGSLASFFSLGNKIQDLWQTSKPVLKLNWGPTYPDDEKDSRIYPSIDFLLEVLQLRYKITEQNPDFPSAYDGIGERLNDLEQRYTATFNAAFSCRISPTTDARVAVDSVLAFYSLRIFHFRSSIQYPFGTTASPQIQYVLRSLISLTHWAIAAGNDLVLDHTQWAIFIGCLEATDPSDRDWLYNRITSARSEATLKIIRETQMKAGGIIHDCPELGYNEFQAHDNLTSLLESQSISVTKHAHGLETAFEAEIGTGGRLIAFCAEYDALPDVGHACGHNLIATASTSAFLGVVSALRNFPKIAGRVRLLGTPAEEGGGGKIKLIEAGAFKGVDAALMVHPNPKNEINKDGTSYGTCLAGTTFKAHFTGLTAHAGAMPWMGINALDAANLAYTAVGLLRQQCRPTDRINIIIKQEGDMPSNIIPDRATLDIGVRCATWKEVGVLRGKVENCVRGASIATGCEYTLEHGMLPYAEIRPNETICTEFTKAMAELGSEFICDLNNVERGGYGTDMGNVTYEVPGFHGTFSVPTRPGENIHGKGFTRAASTDEAHKLAVKCGKAMALTAWRILVDDYVAECVRLDFENDKLRRS